MSIKCNGLESLDDNMVLSSRPLLFVGDVFFTKSDVETLFKTVTHDLKDYLVVANLEGAFELTGGSARKKAVRLALAKIDRAAIPGNLIFSLVNNHVTDFGLENFHKNLKFLAESAVMSTKHKPVCDVGGERVIFLADIKEQCVVTGTNFIPFSNAAVVKIGKAFRGAIAVIHGGIEHREYPTNYQRNVARRIADSGAKAVIFHHSHRVGHSEYWNGALIHYGLGNAFFSDIDGLHRLQESVSEGVLVGSEPKILKLARLQPSGSREPEARLINQHDSMQYRAFYKRTYPIDASLRPRQLHLSDCYTNTQFYAWSVIANSFVRLGLSKTIKQFIRSLFQRDKT